MRNTVQTLAVIFFLLRTGASPAQKVQRYELVSDSFYYAGRYDSALHYAWLAEPLVAGTTTRDSKSYAYFIGQFFSMNHEKAGNLDSAGYWYLRSLKMFEAHADTASNGYGETLINYGNMLNYQTYYAKARPYLQKGKAVMEKHRENVNAYLACLNNLANNYNYSGAYFLARELYRQCMAGLQQHPEVANAVSTGVLFQNMGTLQRKTGNTREAERYLTRSAMAAKKAGDLPTYYEARNNLGYLYLSTGRLKMGQATFDRLCADTLLKQHTGSHPNDLLAGKYVQAINGRGLGREMQGQYGPAEQQYRQSLVIAEKLTDPRGILAAQGNLAHLYSISRRRPAADSIYRRLFTMPLQQAAFDHFAYLTVYSQYCENLLLLQRGKEATAQIKRLSEMLFADLQNNFPGMTEDEQMSYLASLNHYRNLLPFLASQQMASQNEAITYALNRLLQLKGMILAHQQQRLRSLRTSQDAALATLYQQWVSLKQQLYRSYSTGDNRLKTDSLELLATQKAEELAVLTGTPLERPGDSLVTAISQHLQPGEVAVEYIRYQQGEKNAYRYGAFVLQPGKAPVFIPLCREEDLTQCFRTSFAQRFNTVHQLNNRQRVYDLIWKPVQRQLSRVAKVYYSPDGFISYLALEALPGSSKTYPYLLQEVDMVQVSGIRSLLRQQVPTGAATSGAVLWGNIDCSEQAYLKTGFTGVAATKPFASGKTLPDDIKGPSKAGFRPLMPDELPAIRKLLTRRKMPLSVYEKGKATEENFKKDAGRFAGWLHISSHGFYAAHPAGTGAQAHYANRFATQVNPLLRCGLVLNGGNRAWAGKAPPPNREDGILTGYEIAMMDLSKVQLVVLSACETGLGDMDAGSEGVLGLQRAFRLAGAGTTVLSLWNVKARATEQLMNAFYTALIRSNDPATALRQAKLQMLQKENLPDGWAGFVLVQ